MSAGTPGAHGAPDAEHTAPGAARAADPAVLGLSHILTDLLPPTVHTPGGPARYTVSAVFTRRPSAGEVDAIDGAVARAWLDRAGFPHVTTRVSDRRLEIHDTSLEELADGLAPAIAALLADVSSVDADRAHAIADGLVDHERAEERRWESVRALVERVRFDGPEPPDADTALGVARIVTELLPSSLGTDEAPDRYTVVAELTRPPTRTELTLLAGPLPRQRLDERGYTEAGIASRDRRLEIHDASLDELADGLARTVAETLAEVAAAAAARDAQTIADAARLAEQERERARAVAEAAAAISFAPPTVIDHSPHDPGPAARPDVGEWEDEGGSLRKGTPTW